MRDDHIIKTLEEGPVSRLGGAELARVEAHAAACPDCLRALASARVAESLLRARAAESVDVSPFFKTRVMAALRAGRAQSELPAIVRAWQAARAMLSVMATTVALLIGLTVFNQAPDQPQPAELVAAQSIFSPEAVVLDEDDLASDAPAYDQVIGTMYGLEEGDEE